MYLAEIKFKLSRHSDRERAVDSIQWFGGALRKNGQALGWDMPLIETKGALTLFLLLPAKDSLRVVHLNRWAKQCLQDIRSAAVTGPFIKLRGQDESTGLKRCRCRRRSSYVLFTTYHHMDSSLRCGDCFLPVPLYEIKPWRDDEFVDIVTWNSNYHACDTLYMNSGAGEKFGLRQLSDCRSALSKEGRELCRRIEAVTGKPVYYYLFRAYGRSRQHEVARKCPSCRRKWYLKTTWLEFFGFRCNRCRLVSNIAWNTQQ
jgi:predicted  nucleic acid-binding Zn ribbon protein